jgi:hypothetical protein
MKIHASAILWRRCEKATVDTLHGISKGQYHIELNRDPGLEEFFKGLQRINPNADGGYDIVVPIEPFDGEPPVSAKELTIKYLGEGKVRKSWYIRSQRPDTAYELWRPGRGVPDTFVDGAREFILLIRDQDGHFHARWIHDDDFDKLPTIVKEALISAKVGWRELP